MKAFRLSGGALALLSCVAFAVPASAADFQMIGNWLQRRGSIVQIPAQPASGVPANTIVNQTGAPPLTVTIPTSAFKRTAAPGATNVVPVNVPTIAQLATNFQVVAPISMTQGGQNGNVVRLNNWSIANTRPFQTFAWCPGDIGTNPGGMAGATNNRFCLSRDSSTGVGGSASPGSGLNHGIVKYGPGGGGFGGTMQLALTVPLGSGALGVNFTPNVAHFPIGNPVTPGPPQILGGAYSGRNTNMLGVAPITAPDPANRTSPMGVILIGGPQVGTFGAPTTNINYGFPWTTAKVVVSGSNGGGPTQTVWSFTGSDTRTAAGSGMLTLVAGGISRRLGTGFTFINADTIVMSLVAPGTVPAMKPAVAAGAALLLLGAGFLLRRRLF